MARRKKSIITGHDPSYTSKFGTKFQPLSTNLPKADPVQTDEPVKSVESMPQEENIVSKPNEKPIKAKQPRDTGAKSKKKKTVNLFATPKKSHEKGLMEIADKGIDVKDVIRLAGRKANSVFSPKPKYSAPSDVKRLDRTFRYKTTKTIETGILDKLHKSVDPLNLKSDALMVQGQFEKVFWQKMDETILELIRKPSD